MSVQSQLSLIEAITSRKSIRAYLDKPVADETIHDILALAARSPSGTNIQPWQVIVLKGKALRDFGSALVQKYLSGDLGQAEYNYYPLSWREPYLARRRKVGWDLYGSLGIARGEKEKMALQQAQNYCFFGAPVGLLFTMDRDLETGSWLDYGMFIQSVMLAARSFGLDTCPQAAFIDYHEFIAAQLEIPVERRLLCGMALGYRDSAAPENNFITERENVNTFTRFIE